MSASKTLIVSGFLVSLFGITSSNAHANDDAAFLAPIMNLLFEEEIRSVNERFGGNFIVSPRAFDDSAPDIDCDQVFSSTSALENAATRNLEPGTTLCLADGEYTSLDIDFGGVGTEQAPITVAAQNPGNAVISGGEMGVNMSGSYVVLQGIVFRDGRSASSDFLQTRGGNQVPCHFCRVTEISVINLDENEPDGRGRWIHVYGTHNRIDHNWFAGKRTGAPLLATNREIPEGGTLADVPENFHVIDHNYFGDRPPTDGLAYARNGDNEFEGLQLGTSFAHEGDAFITVAFNYFERIDGEAEVISVKSSGNVIFSNTVRDSYGSITNRHGNTTLIANNYVLGDGHPFSGGLRLVDDGHRVINNYVEGARFLNTRFHGGIVLHNTDNSTTNGYQVFENNLVAFNTVTDSVNSLNVNGGNRNNPPRDVRFVNNIIDDAVGPVIRDADIDGLPADSVYAGNYVEGSAFSDDPEIGSFQGFIQTNIDLQDDPLGIARPTDSSAQNLQADTEVNIAPFDAIETDIDGIRRGRSPTSGASEANFGPTQFSLLDFNDVGPVNYRPDSVAPIIQRINISNAGFDNIAQDWNINGGAAITTNASDVFARGASGLIPSTSARISQTLMVEPNTNYALTAFTRGPTLLGARINGVDSAGEFNNSNYRLSQFEFNSGSATSVSVFATLDGLIEANANVLVSDFRRGEFQSSASADNPWIIVEGDSIGQVQGSSNSASGADGSLRFRYNTVEENGSPMVSQIIEGIQANTDYEFSAWVRADDGITGTMGVYAGTSTTEIGSKLMDFAALEQAGAPRGDDGFRRDSFSFNSGDNTTLTIFFKYTANDIHIQNPEFESSGNIGNSDLRIDDVELTFQGPTPAGAKALVDELRLVSFPGR